MRLQARDRGAGHLGQRGFAAAVLLAVVLVLHVVGLEQAQQRLVGRRLAQLLRVPDVGAAGMALLPGRDQVAAVEALADLVVVFRVALRRGMKLPRPPPISTSGPRP